MGTIEGEEVSVGITFVGTHINDEATRVGDDIVLRAGFYHSDSGFHGTEERRYAFETVCLNELYVFDGFVDGIDAFVAGSVSGLSVCGAVEHHESFFGYGGVHSGGFAYECHVDVRQSGEYCLNATETGYFLFGRSQIDEVPRYGGVVFEGEKHLHECAESSSAVVAAESVESVVLPSGVEGRERPPFGRAHGVDMCIEEECGTRGKERADGPYIINVSFGRSATVLKIFFDVVGSGRFVFADGGYADDGLQDTECLCKEGFYIKHS